MSGRRYPPAYLRYLKARLWNLARPSFWGTAIFLSVVGLVIKEYWENPDFFSQWQNGPFATSQPGDSSLSEEERAIAADIDSLPVLSLDAGPASLLSTPSKRSPQTQKKNDLDTTLLDDLIQAQNKSVNSVSSNSDVTKVNPPATANIENPFLTSANKVLQGGNSAKNSNLLGVNTLLNPDGMASVEDIYTPQGMGIMNQGKTATNADVLNPLEKAIEKSNQQNLQNFNSNVLNPKNITEKTLEANNLLNSKPVSVKTNMATYGINDTSNSNGYTLPNLPNNLQNTYTGNSVTENLGTGNIQTPGTNQLQNPYNNFNNKQSLPRVNTPINGVSSIPTPKTNNVLPKMTPYPGQTPIQSTFTTPNANTRNSNLQQYNQLQKPNQLPEELTDWLNKNDYAYP